MDSCTHSHASMSEAQIRETLAGAKARSEAAGQRWTPSRERVLQLLLEAGGLVKAYDLLAVYDPAGVVAPPTIYRALDALVAGGLVHKVASMNAYVACHHPGDAHAASFLICDCCGGVNEIHTPVGMLLSSIEGQSGFKASHVAIEAHGLCGSCQA